MKFLLRFISVFLFYLFGYSLSFSQCTPVPQVESVINGNFEQGYIASGTGSFVTSHILATGPQNPPNGYYVVGRGDLNYTIVGIPVTTSSWVHPWDNIIDGDHTPGMGRAGNALWIDGSGGSGIGVLAWQQTVTVIPNQIYDFSAWFINATSPSTGTARAQIRFVVEAFNSSGTSMGVDQLAVKDYIDESATDASGNYIWEQKDATWTAPIGAATAKISIYNQNTVVTGNDFGIDDISFINSCSALSSAATPPVPNLGPNLNYCENASSSLTLNSNVATNAGAGLVYSWYSGTGNPQTELVHESTSQNTYNITTPGTYRVCVYQPSGCAKSSTVVVTESALASGTDINYCSTNQLVGSISPTTVAPFLSYTWKKNGSAWAGTVNNKTATADGLGAFTLTGTHSNGRAACNVTTTMNVTASTTTISGSDINYCSTNQLTASVADPVMDTKFTYSWTKNGSAWAGTVNNKTVTVDGVGTFTITGTHSNGLAACNANKTFNVTAGATTLSSTIGPGPYSLCTPASQLLTSSLTGAGYSYRWQKNGVDLGATSSSYSATSAGTYHIVIDINRAGCSNITSNDVIISSTNPISPVDVGFCPSRSVTLSVTPALANVYKWYDSDGTTVVQAPSATSSSYVTPVLSASKTYYVEDSRSTAFSLFTTTASTGGNNNPNVTFDVTSPITLNSVKVKRSGQWAGPINLAVQLYNSSNTLIATSSTVTEADGTTPQALLTATFSGGFSIPVGTGYYMKFSGTPNGMTTFSSTTTAGSGVSNLTAGTGGQMFGNWSIGSSSNSCAKVPVNALADCTLPVDFVNFTVIPTKAGNHLIWFVANEKNVDYYEVEKSTDGINFVTIGSVKSSSDGNSKSYTFTDASSVSRTEYYRIKEIDLAGSASYSSIEVVNNSDSEILYVSNNPFEENLQVYFISPEGETNTLRVTDTKGAMIGEYIAKGNEVITIGQSWSSGMYLLQAWNGQTSRTYKIVKK